VAVTVPRPDVAGTLTPVGSTIWSRGCQGGLSQRTIDKGIAGGWRVIPLPLYCHWRGLVGIQSVCGRLQAIAIFAFLCVRSWLSENKDLPCDAVKEAAEKTKIMKVAESRQ